MGKWINTKEFFELVNYFSKHDPCIPTPLGNTFSKTIQCLKLGLQMKIRKIPCFYNASLPAKKWNHFTTFTKCIYQASIIGYPKISLDPPDCFHFEVLAREAFRHLSEQ
jgi:hypothetical protein